MNILVVGSGGREHALAWKISQSPKVKKIYCAPGNAGISNLAECVDISVDDIEGLVQFAKKQAIDLTIVGPELPLVLGITNKFVENNLKVFGPDKICAQFEGSKAYTKKFLEKNNIPTARYNEYTNLEQAINEVETFGFPVVIKADGLAAGKGVIIAENIEVATKTLKEIMEAFVFGDAGKKVIIEEFLTGIEASVLCFVDGKTIMPMESAQDYKRIYDGDKGNNTGGMGTYSPNKIFDEEINKTIRAQILDPIINGFIEEGLDYKGVLFIGLMIENNNPKVLEFNVRFGDPETQSVLMRMDSDIIDVFESVINGSLSEQNVIWSKKTAVCVVLASGGYPEAYKTGKIITGIDEVKDSEVFHAGTKEYNGSTLTAGGRVLGVTAIGDSIEEARNKVYEDINKIYFEGMQYRKDISY
ncbi:MAG: phosphoribosylamine--glycine ligase [Eubacteriaceae bacterium]